MVESSCYCRPCNRNTHIGSEDSITLWIGHLSIPCRLMLLEKYGEVLNTFEDNCFLLRALSHTFCLNCRAWTENLCMKMGPSADRKLQIQRFVWRTDHDDGSGISQSICSCFWSEHISWHWCLDTNILKIENCLQLRWLQAVTVNFSHWDLPPWQGQGTIRVLSGQHCIVIRMVMPLSLWFAAWADTGKSLGVSSSAMIVARDWIVWAWTVSLVQGKRIDHNPKCEQQLSS
jgi:hypothetical protein